MSSVPFKDVVVVGASGIGEFILNALLEKKEHFNSISALVRTSSKSPLIDAFSKQGVHIIRATFDDHDELVNALRGADVVVSALGYAGVGEPQLAVIRAAKEAGVRRFVPSEYGLDTTLPEIETSPFFTTKAGVTKVIKESGLEYTNISVGFFPDYFLNIPAFSRFDLENHVAEIVGDGNAPVSWTHRADVGRFVVAALLHPEVSRNADVRVAGDGKRSIRDLIAILEGETGHSFTVRHVDVEETRQAVQAGVAKGDLYGQFLAGLLVLVADGLANLTHKPGTKLNNADYPEVQPWTLEEVVQHWLRDQKKQ